jgi:hypothetical protein
MHSKPVSSSCISTCNLDKYIRLKGRVFITPLNYRLLPDRRAPVRSHTNSLMEAVNGLLQVGERNARGFGSFHYFLLAAYLKAAGLDLQTPRLLPT